MRAVVFSSELPQTACYQLRIASPFAALGASYGYDNAVRRVRRLFSRRTLIDLQLLDRSDLVVVQRQFPAEERRRFVEALFASGKPVLYDIDDLLTELPQEHRLASLSRDREIIGEALARADCVTVSTARLRSLVAAYNPAVELVPNCIDPAIWPPCEHPRPAAGDRLTIGYAGTLTHEEDLRLVEEVLHHVAQKYGRRVRFRFFGCITGRIQQLPNIAFVPFCVSYAEYARSVRQSGVDIMIVPLQDTEFNRCKSNIKWLEYSACRIPGIYSDVEPYRSCIEHGVTGLLAASSADAWIALLETLLDDQDLRESLAANAYRTVTESYMLEHQVDTVRKIIQRLVPSGATESV